MCILFTFNTFSFISVNTMKKIAALSPKCDIFFNKFNIFCFTGESQYEELLDTWFPAGGSPPSAFLLDTSEEALLLPDWLKLRMIRSHVQQLVDVGMFQ